MQQTTDLHMHSFYSEDGEYSPGALVRMCAEAGIEKMALSDHNTVAGVAEAVQKAAHLNIDCCPAIEIDCCHENISLHVLGYGIDYNSRDFTAVEQNVRKQCAAASRERLELINGLGFILTESDMAEMTANSYWKECWTGELFAEALLGREEYLKCDILKPYRRGGARADNPFVNFHWDYCSQGKPCYVKIDYPSLQEVTAIIHDNGGQAVLAHPGVNLKGRFEKIGELIPLGLDGLEAFSSYHDEDSARWFYNKAVASGIKATRGSDFHGKTKPSVRLGVTPRLI